MPKTRAVSISHENMGRAPLGLAPPSFARLRVGVDVVEADSVASAVAAFGERYLGRLFSPDEVAYALAAPACAAQRLAARFAAKEAAIKAFDLSEAGIGWRDIEVI